MEDTFDFINVFVMIVALSYLKGVLGVYSLHLYGLDVSFEFIIYVPFILKKIN